MHIGNNCTSVYLQCLYKDASKRLQNKTDMCTLAQKIVYMDFKEVIENEFTQSYAWLSKGFVLLDLFA